MKQRISILIVAFVLFAIPAWAIYQSSTFGNRSGVAAGGAALNWTNCVFFLSGEANDTTGDYDMGASDHSEGDTSGTYTDEGLTITATSPLAGLYSFNLGGYGGMTFAVTTMDIIPAQTGSIAFWRNFTVMPTGTEYIVIGDGGTDNYQVWITSAGEIAFRAYDGVGSIQTFTTSDASLTTSTSYFIEVLYDGSAGTCAFYRNDTLLTSSGGGTFNALDGFTGISLADWNNEAGEGKIDNIMIFSTAMRLWDYRNAGYGD